MTNKINIEEQIEHFLEMILPDNASQVQINETRKAFVAGIFQGYQNVMAISELQEDNAEKELEYYSVELTKAITKYMQ